ncbi:TPA: toprim domain-containing protein [Clostridioides difficile]|nr:toprim domain-containing protein [Clostridioides difficile]
MRVRGQELDIDFIEELEQYTFSRARVRENKLQACSPFRDDSRPSFAVNLDNGTWIDSGADVDHLKKGNFISLLALLRDTDYEEAEQYLLDKYGINYSDTSGLDLKLHLDLKVQEPEFTGGILYKYSRYLDKIRGIDVEVQKLFNTTEDVIDGVRCIGIGWYDMQGKLISIKYRGIDDKKFWYVKNGKPIKNHLFGLDVFIKNRTDELWVTEAEIDAMYLWTLGKRAVALGRGSVNEEQIDKLKKSGAKTIVIATDNDAVGRALAETLINELQMYMDVKVFRHPKGVKDVNELPQSVRDELDFMVENVSFTICL